MMRISKILLMALIMTCSGTALSTSQERKGVSVEYLGTNNTLIRIADDAKYLLLPIQDNGEEATVNVVVNGKLETSFMALPRAG